MSSEIVRECKNYLVKRFTEYCIPPLRLPPDSLIEEVVCFCVDRFDERRFDDFAELEARFAAVTKERNRLLAFVVQCAGTSKSCDCKSSDQMCCTPCAARYVLDVKL